MLPSINLGKSELLSSRLVYGCYRIMGDWSAEGMKKGKMAVQAAIDEGYTHFDNADFYGHGRCEELFAEVLHDNPGIRDKIIITTKCGIIRIKEGLDIAVTNKISQNRSGARLQPRRLVQPVGSSQWLSRNVAKCSH